MAENSQNVITTFVQVHTDDLDELIADEELVLALMDEFGVDTGTILDLAKGESAANPEVLFQILEERWNGYGRVLSLEDQLPLLQHLIRAGDWCDSGLRHLLHCGRPTPVVNAYGPIRVIFPHQCGEIADAMREIPKELLQGRAHFEELNAQKIPPNDDHWQEVDVIAAPLWQLYDGLEVFTQRAASEEAYVLVGGCA